MKISRQEWVLARDKTGRSRISPKVLSLYKPKEAPGDTRRSYRATARHTAVNEAGVLRSYKLVGLGRVSRLN